MSDKLSLIASMAATLEAGDRAHAHKLLDTPSGYATRAYGLYLAAIQEIADRGDAQVVFDRAEIVKGRVA